MDQYTRPTAMLLVCTAGFSVSPRAQPAFYADNGSPAHHRQPSHTDLRMSRRVGLNSLSSIHLLLLHTLSYTMIQCRASDLGSVEDSKSSRYDGITDQDLMHLLLNDLNDIFVFPIVHKCHTISTFWHFSSKKGRRSHTKHDCHRTSVHVNALLRSPRRYSISSMQEKRCSVSIWSSKPPKRSSSNAHLLEDLSMDSITEAKKEARR